MTHDLTRAMRQIRTLTAQAPLYEYTVGLLALGLNEGQQSAG